MNNKYEGNSGKKYKYDLSKPEDKRAYTLDYDAQREDNMYIDASGDVKRDKINNPNLAGICDG